MASSRAGLAPGTFSPGGLRLAAGAVVGFPPTAPTFDGRGLGGLGQPRRHADPLALAGSPGTAREVRRGSGATAARLWR